ncbi:MAG: hypothetical protein Edafosvirus4_53 [Edafosvirus sp.]|uniref:Uncharacterized protein n=1 Tax=Edafosvirus sp. TaxID=2487765 RepID=A0A3G4ZXB6_9VIRU|nr:MAG: hypothetical protein Edafosvirus4_53 [Edafosvirus sp.]
MPKCCRKKCKKSCCVPVACLPFVNIGNPNGPTLFTLSKPKPSEFKNMISFVQNQIIGMTTGPEPTSDPPLFSRVTQGGATGLIQFNTPTRTMYNITIVIYGINIETVDFNKAIFDVVLTKASRQMFVLGTFQSGKRTEPFIITNDQLQIDRSNPIYENGDILTIINRSPAGPPPMSAPLRLYSNDGGFGTTFVTVTIA